MNAAEQPGLSEQPWQRDVCSFRGQKTSIMGMEMSEEEAAESAVGLSGRSVIDIGRFRAIQFDERGEGALPSKADPRAYFVALKRWS